MPEHEQLPAQLPAFGTLGRNEQVRRLKRLGLAALAEYPLALSRVAPLVHLENTTFRVESGDGRRYVLRISRPGKHTLEEVCAEMAWLAALQRATTLVVPEPVATRDGALATMTAVAGVPEPRICALLQWVEGRFLNVGLTPRHLYQVGAFTARLHEHAAGFQPPVAFTRGRVAHVDALWEAETLRRFAAARPAADVTVLREAIQSIRATVAGLSQTPGTYGLIHADLHQENYLFHAGEARAIDFDDCGYGHYLYDLAVTLSEVQHRADVGALREALLAGYCAVRALPPAYEVALPALLERRRIDLIMWRIDSRDHPAFRDRWQAGVTHDLSRLATFLRR